MASRFDRPQILNPDGRLRAGCYLICYTPDTPESDIIHYDGQRHEFELRAAKRVAESLGAAQHVIAQIDLRMFGGSALTSQIPVPKDRPIEEPKVGITDAIPIPVFPRDEYRFYLCVKSVPCWSITPAGFNLVLESHSYDCMNGFWYPEGQFIAKMAWQLPPPGYPSNGLHATGQVYELHGGHNGTLTMTWISPFFRRAKLVIHRATEEKLPGPQENKGAEEFKSFDWQLEAQVVENEEYLLRNGQATEVPWTRADLLKVMKVIRQSQQPDQLWRYDLLCVPTLIDDLRGITYYQTENSSCGYARELATIATDATFPENDGTNGDLYNYGRARGEMLKSQPDLFFRTAMHELGHAMGLNHNLAEDGFMMPTNVLARVENQVSATFPGNAKLLFSSGDMQRLRHWPDVLVRPGTNADGNVLPSITVPIFPDPGQDEQPPPRKELARDVFLHATALHDQAEVPLGAPVRIVYELVCRGHEARVPESPSLKSGALSIQVTAPDGSVRTVMPMTNVEDTAALRTIYLTPPGKDSEARDSAGSPPSDRVIAATTLLGQDERLLFPSPGEYALRLRVTWWDSDRKHKNRGVEYFVEDETKVMITPPETDEHVEAARLVLGAPELQEVLVRHSDSFPKANKALEKALESKVLGPHFAYMEFRVQADRLLAVDGNLKPAFDVLFNTKEPKAKPRKPLLTEPERETAADILSKARPVKVKGVIGDWRITAAELLESKEKPDGRLEFASVVKTKKAQGQSKKSPVNDKTKQAPKAGARELATKPVQKY